MFGHFEICEFICKNLKDSNVTNDNGVTPLHLAAKSDKLSICKLLIKNAANKSPIDNDGWTPFHYAAMQASPYYQKVNSCIEFLKSVAGDKNLKRKGDLSFLKSPLKMEENDLLPSLKRRRNRYFRNE
jgi:ankyrin repeat protein